MSIKIRVSYTDEEELAGVIRLLSPMVKSWKVAKRQEGAHKNAYIWMKDGRSPKEQRKPRAKPERSVRGEGSE